MADEITPVTTTEAPNLGFNYAEPGPIGDVTTTSTTTGAGTPRSIADVSTFDLLRNIASSSTAKGAALGALMSNILGTISEPGGVARPIDLSQYGIKPRTTTITPPRYVPFADYGTRDLSAGLSPELVRQFGGLSGLGNLVPAASLAARPSYFSAQQPFQITSPGAGQQLAPALSLTPRANQQISPLTGALLGAAAGYLLPSGSGTGTVGGTGGTGGTGGAGGGYSAGSALGELFGRALTGVKDLFTTRPSYSDVVSSGDLGSQGDFTFDPGGEDITLTGPDDYYIPENEYYYYNPDTDVSYGDSSSDYYYPSNPSSAGSGGSSYWGGKEGGMATPLMADGGQVEPSYYTYGTAVDPRQIMQQMAAGGYAHGGSHVPTVEGRHDYRSGSRVSGEGDGQSDDIPAMLADGEYVFDADTVAQLGNGSTKAGSDLLDKFREEIRSHKRSAPVDKIPPPSKSPLQYLKQAQSRSKKNG